MKKDTERKRVARHKGHLLSIDLESWIFSRKIEEKKLSLKELKRLDNNYTPRVLSYILKTLKKNEQRITFFVVGKLEEVYPGIIEKILKEGHEIGWHSHTHANLSDEEILKQELNKSSKIIKNYKMKGFQAPTVIFFKKGYKLLRDYGFEYSSSIYGNSNAIHNFHGIYEIPVSTAFRKYKPIKSKVFFPSNMTFANLAKFGLPIGSSYFWGVLGKKFYKSHLQKKENKGEIVNMFIHEWQIINPKSEEYKDDVNFFWNPLFLPYKMNLSSMFEHILQNFRFVRFKDYLKEMKKR